MDTRIIFGTFWVFLTMAGFVQAVEPTTDSVCKPGTVCAQEPNEVVVDEVDKVLEQLHKTTSGMRSYEGQIEYKYIQPLLESESLRKGVLYYVKIGEVSKLRINFKTLKQDDEKERKYAVHYIFDGVWLTELDYQTKTPTKYQVTEANKPVDAFTAANQTLPMVGFMKPEELKKEFEVELVEQKKGDPANFVQLHLIVKPNSTYKDDYLTIDFWVDKKVGLPLRVVAVSTEEDICELKFLKPKINKGIGEKIFDFKIPQGFSEPEIVPLKKKKGLKK